MLTLNMRASLQATETAKAAGILQKAGLISYQRGQVTITDRARLEEASCECYAQLYQHLLNWRDHDEHHSSVRYRTDKTRSQLLRVLMERTS